MGRPRKAITYYNRDIDITDDTRIRKVLRKHGGLGGFVYEEILGMVYGTGNYYLRWKDDYILDIADKIYEQDAGKIRQIFETILESELFSKEIFDQFGILTSHGIQERYLERVKNSSRQDEVILDFAVPDEELAGVSRNNPEFSGINPNNPELNGINRNNPELNGVFQNKTGKPEKTLPKEKEKAKGKEKDCTRALSLSVNTQERVRARGDETEFLSQTFQNAEPEEDEATQPEKSGLSPPEPALRDDTPCSPKSNQNHACGDSRGNYGDSAANADPLSVPGVISEWNKRFKGTRSEYRHFYATGFLDENIRHRLKLDPDIETFRKVFDYARLEFDGRGIDGKRFIWSLPGLFNKEESFDLLLSKAAVGNISPARGAPVLTAQDYDSDPW